MGLVAIVLHNIDQRVTFLGKINCRWTGSTKGSPLGKIRYATIFPVRSYYILSLLKPIVLPSLVTACILLLIRPCTKETNKLYLHESLKTSLGSDFWTYSSRKGSSPGVESWGWVGKEKEVSGKDKTKYGMTRESLTEYKWQTRCLLWRASWEKKVEKYNSINF